MFETLTELVAQYGLVGLFIVSAMGSTIFIPFSAELTFPVLASAGVWKVAILLSATFGGVAGSWINYWIGTSGLKAVRKKMGKGDIKKAHDIMNKYGALGITLALALPLPLPVDPITILCGVSKMNFRLFTLAVFTGKLMKYALVLGIVSIVL